MSNELHMHTVHISKLYTDDTGHFPIKARRGNQYLIVAYHCNSNDILVSLFKTRKDKNFLKAYKSIISRLWENGMSVNLQILDNEASASLKQIITEELVIKYQLVPPDIHRRNLAEQSIRAFKAHFLSILVGIASDFPKFLWDRLFPQTEITLNSLRQATLNQTKSAWEFLNATFDYAATPIEPLWCRVIIHQKTAYVTHGTSAGNMDGASDAPSYIINANVCPPRTPKLSRYVIPLSTVTTS